MGKGYFTMGNEIYAAIKAGAITAEDLYVALFTITDLEQMQMFYYHFKEYEKI